MNCIFQAQSTVSQYPAHFTPCGFEHNTAQSLFWAVAHRLSQGHNVFISYTRNCANQMLWETITLHIFRQIFTNPDQSRTV